MRTTHAKHEKKATRWLCYSVAFGFALGTLPFGLSSAQAKTLELWVPLQEQE